MSLPFIRGKLLRSPPTCLAHVAPILPGSLNENKIGSAGTQALAAALPSCVALTTLVYAAVLCNVEHAVRDAHHRAVVHTWCQLCLGSLTWNQIGAAGAQALAAALPSCPALTELKYVAFLNKAEHAVHNAHYTAAVRMWRQPCLAA